MEDKSGVATMEAEPADAPKQVRGEAATALILDATHQVLMERGYGATTIDAVADRAGVARATIYRRWPSKQALVAAAARLGLQKDLVIPDVGSFREEARMYLLNRLGWFVSGQATRAIEGLMAAAAEAPELSQSIAQGTEPFQRSFYEVLERGIRRGEVRPDIDFQVIQAMASGPLVFVNVFNRVDPDVAFVDKVCDLIVTACRPEGAS